MTSSKYRRPGEPSVEEMRDDFVQTPILRLGRLALWNFMTKNVIDLRSPTLDTLKTHYERRGALNTVNDFEVLTAANFELPVTMQDQRRQKDMYLCGS